MKYDAIYTKKLLNCCTAATRSWVCWCWWSSWACSSSAALPTLERRMRRTLCSSPCLRYYIVIRITFIPSVINVPGSVLGNHHHDLGWLWRHCPNYLVWKTGGIRQEQKLFHLNQDVISLFQRVPSAACSASPSPSPSLSTTSTSSTRRPRLRRRYWQRRRGHLGKRLKEVTL